MDYRVELGQTSYFIGPSPSGHRVTGPIAGGSFEGPKLRGTVLPTGGDYGRIRDDDTQDAEVRAVLQTEDGALIYMTYAGMIHPVSIARRVLAGEDLDQSALYWHMAHRFEAPQGPYEWLNRVVAVSAGRGGRRSAEYRIEEII